MNLKITIKFSLILLMLGLFACETHDILNSKLSNDLYEFDEVNDPRFSLRDWDCASPLRYKLITFDENLVGAAEVYIEDGKLVFKFSLLNTYADWGIFKIYFFFGSNAEWASLTSGYGMVPGVNDWPKFMPEDNIIEFIPPKEGSAMVKIDLKDIAEDCFIWAAKVSFQNGESQAHSFVIIDEESYTWEEELQIRGNGEICLAQCERPGTGTIGYWKNHPEAWPVEEITIGGKTYSKEDAIENMKEPTKGDKTYNMFEQLVAAKLNVLIGNDDSCISGTITVADAWLTSNPLGTGVGASSKAWKDPGSELHTMLDDYNNGLLPCADHRD